MTDSAENVRKPRVVAAVKRSGPQAEVGTRESGLALDKVIALVNYDRATRSFEVPTESGKRLVFLRWGINHVQDQGPLKREMLPALFENKSFVKYLQDGSIHAITSMNQVREELLPREGLYAEQLPHAVRSHIERVRRARKELEGMVREQMSRYTHEVLRG